MVATSGRGSKARKTNPRRSADASAHKRLEIGRAGGAIRGKNVLWRLACGMQEFRNPAALANLDFSRSVNAADEEASYAEPLRKFAVLKTVFATA
jgi:hypothetical protein